MEVQFIRPNYQRFYEMRKLEIDDAIRSCFTRGDLCLRKDVWDLEKTVANFVGTKYCATVNSGTDALFLSLLALDIGPGDEVITVSNTFIATIQAIVHAGATPVLIDVKDDEQMDMDKLEGAITPKTKAIIPVEYTGAMVDYDRLLDIASRHNIPIVDDYCQALGAKYKDKRVGSIGLLNCLSFNTAKLMGGMSDGGAVTTDSRELYEKICLLRNHWNVHQLSVDRNDYPQPEEMRWAWKSRLSNINAAFLNVKFRTIKFILQRRREIAMKYNEQLAGLPLVTPHDQEGRIWQEYHLQVPDRNRLKEHLNSAGVETLVRDEVPNHKMKGLGLEHWELPVTEKLAKEVIRLPLYEYLSDDEVDYVINAVKQCYKEKTS